MSEALKIIVSMASGMLQYVMVYTIIFHAKLRREKRWIVVTGFLGLALQVMVLCMAGKNWDGLVEFIYSLVIPTFWLEERKKKWYALYIFILVGISVFNTSVRFILAVILGWSEREVFYNVWTFAFCVGIVLLLLFCVHFYQKRKGEKLVEVEVGIFQYTLLVVGVLCSVIMLAVAQGVSSDEPLSLKVKNTYGIAVSAVCIIFVVLCLWQGITVYQQMKYKNEAAQYAWYMDLQQKQIEEIIQKDEMMRKFRHDMHAHLTALKGLAEEGRQEEIGEYVRELERHVYTQKEIVYTGNSAVDAVLGEMFGNAAAKGIAIEHEISLGKGCMIKPYDLCTVLFNLLQNAMEACEKIEAKKDRKIYIKMYPFENLLGIVVRNSVVGKVLLKNNRPQSTKGDIRYHGLGLENVEETVKKYDGDIRYACEGGWFTAQVNLENRMN